MCATVGAERDDSTVRRSSFARVRKGWGDEIILIYGDKSFRPCAQGPGFLHRPEAAERLGLPLRTRAGGLVAGVLGGGALCASCKAVDFLG